MDSGPFRVAIRVFMPGMKDSSFMLGKGERLFSLSDGGLLEYPKSGPDEVLVLVEAFGSYPVAVFKVSGKDALAWRKTTAADHARMMERIRRQLSPKAAA